MKILIGLIIACIVFFVSTQRPSYELEPLPISAFFLFKSNVLPVVTKKDLFVYADAGPTGRIMRRNDVSGTYLSVANYTEAISYFMATNGKWIAFFNEKAGYNDNILVSIDENNQISQQSIINSYGGYLLSDDTYVGVILDLQTSDAKIQAWEYNASDNNWTIIPGTNITVDTGIIFESEYSNYRATDTHLIFTKLVDVDNFILSAQIYERQVDRSWTYMDSFLLNTTFGIGSINYNGVDTLVHSLRDLYQGAVFIHTKINGTWIEQVFTVQSLGYRPGGYLGLVTTFVDKDTILLNDGREGYNASVFPVQKNGGKVLVMHRGSNGLWKPVLDLIGTDFFGLGLGVNDKDLIVSSIVPDPNGNSGVYVDIKFSASPYCKYQAINVTCLDQYVSSCADLATIDISQKELYAIVDTHCGDVSANMTGTSLTDNDQTLQIEFHFTRDFGVDAYCNATISCGTPPTGSTTPTSSISPSGGNSPATGPAGSKTSGASSFSLTIFSLVVAFLSF